MGRKAKYTFEQKLEAVLDYQSGKKSAADIALELDIGKHGANRIRQWTNLYKTNGPEADLQARSHNVILVFRVIRNADIMFPGKVGKCVVAFEFFEPVFILKILEQSESVI